VNGKVNVERLFASAIFFTFLTFLFPLVYNQVGASNSTSSLKPMAVGLTLILLLASGFTFVYYILKEKG